MGGVAPDATKREKEKKEQERQEEDKKAKAKEEATIFTLLEAETIVVMDPEHLATLVWEEGGGFVPPMLWESAREEGHRADEFPGFLDPTDENRRNRELLRESPNHGKMYAYMPAKGILEASALGGFPIDFLAALQLPRSLEHPLAHPKAALPLAATDRHTCKPAIS